MSWHGKKSELCKGKTVEQYIISIYIKILSKKHVYKMHRSSGRIHAKRLIVITSEEGLWRNEKGRRQGGKGWHFTFPVYTLIYLNLSQ